MVSVSIIVPVYNGGEKFKKCLLSLEKACPKPKEVIVVADGCSDDSGSMAENMGVEVISMGPQPQGPARARNAGAKAATGNILFFVDADVEIHADCTGIVQEYFQENPNIAAVIGSYDDAPFETNFLSQYKNLFHRYTHQKARFEASTFWGACGAIRREIFLAVGGFDKRFTFPSIEDIELGYRLKKSGHVIRLLKNLQVKHLKRWDLTGLLKTDIFHRALPWTRLILQQGKIPSDLNLKIGDRISCAAVFGLIFTFLSGFFNASGWVVSGFFLALILMLNSHLYLYFLRLRGGFFAFRSMIFHCFYLFYGGLSFMYGKLIRHPAKSCSINHDRAIESHHRGKP